MNIERTAQGLTIQLASEQDTDQLGRALAEVVSPGVVIGLVGPLGAGKTRFTRALAEALDVDPTCIASPTFVLIHEYEGRIPVYHFDAYRLPDADEFENLGVSDYFAGDGVCLVEWADLVLDRLPLNAWMIRIEPTGPEQRTAHVWIPDNSKIIDRIARFLTED
ncbi:tRNA threonylcarbamoyladenosine biosynthesis protein TsaE [Singulisphaera sp. GP187]|uniref:tRNA (adenosine(37)-N6)-threonylcarbamoyltransferase complex ATPase subunit type 1 TsaE n=1 Tax=Singulisphaera sp. GP187 TaxID=1882752 RepID=UPI000925E342|nr:tRNA (adenosine(37)-N6)-threonylcarbamoyltransferase complex ATPase subunit type 1 TsaE [Singulisphaera sp. GP187]SIN86099.1 tRNA threonylcarbamoyladenosine biosynthesis protein TsaE [Singulisphaera sp. GP187]